MEQLLLHRDPRIFEDAMAFRPRRWEADVGSRLPKYAYLPFSAGPRGCVGADLALMEMVALLALVARRFHVRADRDVEPSGEFLLVPAGGMPVTLEPRG
jgi:cytochrome P450